MNRLVLTDEEDAEYRSFESLIATNDNFKSSKVMLCIFHAIWQPFKRDVYPLCPGKSKKGKPIELTKIGSAWGELRYCLNLDAFCQNFLPNINIFILFSNLYMLIPVWLQTPYGYGESPNGKFFVSLPLSIRGSPYGNGETKWLIILIW